jgi:hypothetical protein
MLDRRLALGLVAVALPFAVGCATLPRTSAEDVASGESDRLLIEGDAPAETTAYVGAPAQAGEQVEVAWQDNGQAIRPLSEDEGPRSLSAPKFAARKRPVLIGSGSSGSPAKLAR